MENQSRNRDYYRSERRTNNDYTVRRSTYAQHERYNPYNQQERRRVTSEQIRRNGQQIRRREEQRKKRQTRVLMGLTLIVLALVIIFIGFNYLVKHSNSKFFISMRDREAPVVEVKDISAINGKTVDIMDFVTKIDDITNVTAAYIKAPDYSVEGEQQVIIEFTDEAGNFIDKAANLTVINDDEAPVIYGDDDVYLLLGDTLSYKNLVSVEDNKDPEPSLEIDNSNVDLNNYGDYVVSYTATDQAGNIAYKDVWIHVTYEDDWNIIYQRANELCDQVINAIITDDMDDLHKVWAVYNYVRSIPYVGGVYSRDYVIEGYNILKNRYGDCFGSYSAVRLLLDRLGIENTPIESPSPHFWNMVTLDGENWYHVDATNWQEWNNQPYMCMISDARLNQISDFHKGTHYHDQYSYPSTPEESMYIPDDLWDVYYIDIDIW